MRLLKQYEEVTGPCSSVGSGFSQQRLWLLLGRLRKLDTRLFNDDISKLFLVRIHMKRSNFLKLSV